MPSPAEATTLKHELGVAVCVMEELTAVEPFSMADMIVTKLRDEGAVLYDHDANVARYAALETYNAIMQSVAMAIMMQE